MTHLRTFFVVAVATSAVAVACGGSDDASVATSPTTADAGPRGVEPAGQACTAPTQCYSELDGATVKGTVSCLSKVTNGYCTHTCTADSDCCATPGECRTGVKQVCAPFANDSSTKYCFLSCESADIQAAISANASAGYYDGGAADGGGLENAYCQSYAATSATCRSTGGGNQNRKVCIPQQ